MNNIKFGLSAWVLFVLMMIIGACEHDSIEPEPEPEIVDSSGPCHPDTVYFQSDILPILQSSCAYSGCHDEATAADDIILNNYANVIETGKVKAFDVEDSELYEVIIETDEDKIMPPPPNAALSNEQIQRIEKWINQGALNLGCDPDLSSCDSIDVSFSQTIQPIMADNCVGCHSADAPEAGIDLSSYAGVKATVDAGTLYGSVAWLDGFAPMPDGGDQLSECTVAKIKSWIDDGALDN